MSDRVLVDTSAWTRFFRKKPDDPATADEVERLLTEDRDFNRFSFLRSIALAEEPAN